MKVNCFIRKKSVAATPEEIVRQSVLHKLIVKLSYPQSLIAVEKELSDLAGTGPKRRLDIVAFAKKETLVPLLIIECKAKTLDQKALSQALAYNHYLSAPFFAVMSADKAAFFAKQGMEWVFMGSEIPSYSELTCNFRHLNLI